MVGADGVRPLASRDRRGGRRPPVGVRHRSDETRKVVAPRRSMAAAHAVAARGPGFWLFFGVVQDDILRYTCFNVMQDAILRYAGAGSWKLRATSAQPPSGGLRRHARTRGHPDPPSCERRSSPERSARRRPANRPQTMVMKELRSCPPATPIRPRRQTWKPAGATSSRQAEPLQATNLRKQNGSQSATLTAFDSYATIAPDRSLL